MPGSRVFVLTRVNRRGRKVGWRNLGPAAQKACFLEQIDPLGRATDRHTSESIRSEAQAPALIMTKTGLGMK